MHADCCCKQPNILPCAHTFPSCLVLQLCVENTGRPAAAALARMVRSAAIAFRAGHSMSRLRLEVEHGGFGEVNLTSASCRLTETDKQHRQNFLDTVRPLHIQQPHCSCTRPISRPGVIDTCECRCTSPCKCACCTVRVSTKVSQVP